MMQRSGSSVMKQHEGRDYSNWVSGAAEHRAPTVTDSFSVTPPPHTHTHKERQITFFCFSSPNPFPLPLTCFSAYLFYLYTSPSPESQSKLNTVWQLDVFIHAHTFKSLVFEPFLHSFPSQPFLLFLRFFLLSRHVHISSKAPLFYISLDNDSDTLTLALT